MEPLNSLCLPGSSESHNTPILRRNGLRRSRVAEDLEPAELRSILTEVRGADEDEVRPRDEAHRRVREEDLRIDLNNRLH